MSSYQIKRNRDRGNDTLYIYWSEKGRSKRVSTRTNDMEKAKDFLAEWIKLSHQAPEISLQQVLTLEDLFDNYIKRYVETECTSTKSFQNSKKNLLRHFGHLHPRDIKQPVIDQYIELRQAGKIGRKSTLGSIRTELSHMTACLTWSAGLRNGRKKAAYPPLIDPTDIQPMDFIEPPAPRDRWLKDEEIEKLLQTAERYRRGNRLSRIERFIWLALETGSRKQAILDLTWDRVDFDTNVIHMEVPGRKITKKKRPTVPISTALKRILLIAHDERINELVMDSKSDVWATLQYLAINAGLTDVKCVNGEPRATGIHPHVLRHTAATKMARKGVPLWVIAKILGNSMKMIEQVYAKHSPDDLRFAVEKIAVTTI